MLASLLLATTIDAEVVNGLRNLAQMHQVALAVQLTRSSGQAAPADLPPDVWGTPYRIEGDRITSAGSDKKFEDGTAKSAQFTGTAGDVVFVNGAPFRSNRNWLYERASSDDAKAALEELHDAELLLMRMSMPLMRNLTLARMTTAAMQRGGMDHDAWGTKFRIDGDRVISAGADKKFDPASWSRAATLDLGEDIIVEKGQIKRAVDAAEAIGELGPITPIEQPVDEPKPEGQGYHRMVGNVVDPVVTKRVDPEYDDAYRRARIWGIVMIQAMLSKEGKIEEMRLIKSLAPGLDAAAMDAVRQWTFKPATIDGKPVPVIYNAAVPFALH